MLAALPFLASPRSGQTVYIEEPEAHLFPSAQRSVIELIATVFNFVMVLGSHKIKINHNSKQNAQLHHYYPQIEQRSPTKGDRRQAEGLQI